VSSCCLLGVLVPGSGLVVAGAGFEAAVQDADQTVAELAQGGVVADVAVPQRVVVGAGSRRSAQGAERLLVQGIGQALVAHISGQDDFLLARGSGDGAGAGVVLTGTGTGVAGGVVAELCEHPGAQDGPQSRLAEVDLSVRVPAKTGLDRPFQGGNLLVAGRDQGGQGPDRRAVGGRDNRRLGEVLGGQRGHDRGG